MFEGKCGSIIIATPLILRLISNTQSLEDQFPPGSYKYARHDVFKFKNDTEPLQLTFPAGHDPCIITALEPANGKVIYDDVAMYTTA